MATQPTPGMGGGAAPAASPAPSPQAPSQQQAPPEMMMLAKIHQLFSRMAQANPVMSSGLQKAMDGINEAQSAMVSQPRPQSTQENPPM